VVTPPAPPSVTPQPPTTPPVTETPPAPTTPPVTDTPPAPVEEEGGGGGGGGAQDVLPQADQGGGGGGAPPAEVPPTEAATAPGTLPFTGPNVPMLLLVGVGLLGLGAGLRRVGAERG
jgi:hypothetical protein